MSDPAEHTPVLIFDGDCALCNADIRFILAHERAPTLRFASSRSELGQSLAAAHGYSAADLEETFLLVENGQAFARSDAACRQMRYLKAPWRWLGAARFAPRPVRDWAYARIARNRFQWFGRQDPAQGVCLTAAPETRRRFLGADALGQAGDAPQS